MSTSITNKLAGTVALVTGGSRGIGAAIANPGDTDSRAPSIKYQPKSTRYYFDVGIGSVCLSGEDTGGRYCLIEASLAPGMGVPRHAHTREDETYYVLSGELEVIVGDEVFILREGDTLIAPRDIPHQLRNSGKVENHYLLMFSPSGFEGFLGATAVPAPDNAAAPTKPPAVAVRNVHELATDYGILFG
jgi:quercetin dioxygenase-like cupin family protein